MHADDTLVANSREVRTHRIDVALTLIAAIGFLYVADVPYIPLIALHFRAHDHLVSWPRTHLAEGRTQYAIPYLIAIFFAVVFWTGLAARPYFRARRLFSLMPVKRRLPSLRASQGSSTARACVRPVPPDFQPNPGFA